MLHPSPTPSTSALLEALPGAALWIDLEGRVLGWNDRAAAICGGDLDAALGSTLADLGLVRPEDQRSALRASLEDGRWSGGLRRPGADGTKEVLCRWTPVRDDDGRPRSIFLVETDREERRLLEEQLLRSQRIESIGTLAAGIAHDLNNVLAPVAMSLQTLREEAGEELDDVLRTLETSVARGTDLVRQVLVFARGMGGQRQELDPAKILEELRTLLVETFPRHLAIGVSAEVDGVAFHGDPTQIHQVLLNLCLNARDAMPDDGQLRLRAESVRLAAPRPTNGGQIPAGDWVVFSVTDTGAGIDAAVQDRIFEPFYTTKEVGSGTGLGLSTALSIVLAHGGGVEVESGGGPGTTFRVYLPAHRASHAPVASPRPRRPALGAGQTILVVDDEAPLRSIFQRLLEKLGYRPLIAADGLEALELFTAHADEIRVVITDLSMPGMNGNDLIARIRQQRQDIPIVATSGLCDADSVEGLMTRGVDRFLAKPFRREDLDRVLTELVPGPAEDGE